MEGFSFQSLGDNLNDSTPWKDALNPFFQNLEDDYFFLCFEDHFIIDDVNLQHMKMAQEIMENDPSIGKIRLHPKYNDDMCIGEYNEYFELGPTIPNSYVATSLRPSIWRKSLFLKLLNHIAGIKTPHNFERFNDGDNINTKVLIPKIRTAIYSDLDAMRGGNINPQGLSAGKINMDYYWMELKEEDVEEFKQIEKLWKK